MSRSLLALALLAACGDDSGATKTDAAMPDVRIFDAPAPDCDYVEQADATNDTSSTGGVTETTGLTFSTKTILCGAFDHTHFDSGFGMIDGDSYTIDVAADTDLVVRIVAPGVQTLEFVGVDVYNTGGMFAGGLTYYGNHGVVSVRVPAGKFEILPFALHSTPQTESFPYRIEISADTPDTRCPEVTIGGYNETMDGAQDTGNDVYVFPSGSPIDFTTSTGDAPEDTSIVLAPDVSIRFTGSSANINAPDKYEDTDTYEIATGNGTNELAIRLTWPEASTNLDWHLFEQNTKVAVVSGLTNASAAETKLTAVKPNTTYWLSVSAEVGKTATYNTTLCPTQFTLP